MAGFVSTIRQKPDRWVPDNATQDLAFIIGSGASNARQIHSVRGPLICLFDALVVIPLADIGKATSALDETQAESARHVVDFETTSTEMQRLVRSCISAAAPWCKS